MYRTLRPNLITFINGVKYRKLIKIIRFYRKIWLQKFGKNVATKLDFKIFMP